jgi:alpha-tubulin suppressor-like RCC1 family protein
VSVGTQYVCAVLSDGGAACWGYNLFGQLGDGTQTTALTPVPVKGLTGATAISAGNTSTCALLANGTVDCWGFNQEGELGNGGPKLGSTTPVAVPGLSGVTGIAVGWTHVCALLSGGTVTCWGDNTYGQLGNATTMTQSPTPVAVPGLMGVKALSGNWDTTCALLGDGTVTCWGEDPTGQSGPLAPKAVQGITGATAVSAGGDVVCALRNDGTLETWGENFDGTNYGILGTGPAQTQFVWPPLPVLGLTGVTAVTAGSGGFSCAIAQGGTVLCWGVNQNGVIGDGLTTDATSPTAVSGALTATSVSAGYYNACAIDSNGAVWCWGLNNIGELGNGTSMNSSVPVRVAN